MESNKLSKSLEVRKRLGHPVVDSDGHTVEFEPAAMDYLRDIGGSKMVDRLRDWNRNRGLRSWYEYTPEERRQVRAVRPIWWALGTKNTLDRATGTAPNLLRERLDETGIDFTVLYTTLGLFAPRIEDDELRQVTARAFNKFNHDVHLEHSSRMTPAAIIPMHTPQEAINELDYAVGTLGMKAVMLADYAMRPIPYLRKKYGPDVMKDISRWAFWLDFFALDSDYDYDPVWRRCLELKVVPSFHSQGIGWGSRTSISNFMYNHIGHFAAAAEAVCKALFFGGVTRRFPRLNFAFLECGTGWACNLYADIIGHWEKRNAGVMDNYDPKLLNVQMMVDLLRKYGGKMVEGKLTESYVSGLLNFDGKEDPAWRDEFAACGIEGKQDIKERFVPHFYFGCEADDPVTAWAFDKKRTLWKLNSMQCSALTSGIGTWLIYGK